MSAITNFESHDIRGYIAPFIGCPTITDNGKNCRPDLTLNKYKDSYTGTEYNCNYYCMRNCTGEKLSHIFMKPPTKIITKEEKNNVINIDEIYISLNSINDSEDSINFNYTPGNNTWGIMYGSKI